MCQSICVFVHWCMKGVLLFQLLIDTPVTPITSILPLLFVISVTAFKQVKQAVHTTYASEYFWSIRGAHILFCKLDELMMLLLCCLHYIRDPNRNACDKKNWFHTAIIIPWDKMSGKGDGSSASSVDLSWRDFQAMMYYDFCQGRSLQESFQSLKHCLGDKFPSKATVFRWFRLFMSGARTLEDDDCCGRMAMTVPQKMFLGLSPWERRTPK